MTENIQLLPCSMSMSRRAQDRTTSADIHLASILFCYAAFEMQLFAIWRLLLALLQTQ